MHDINARTFRGFSHRHLYHRQRLLSIGIIAISFVAGSAVLSYALR